MRMLFFFSVAVMSVMTVTCAIAQEGGNAAGPAGSRQVMAASDEAEAAIEGHKVPAGFKISLFAAEPHVANVSSFDIAPDGKAYVVEVFRRRGGGVLDMRNLSAEWLDDDLASRSVADRIALVKRRVSPQEQRAMQVESDRVRVVEDSDSDGRADRATVFADGFNQLEAGTAAGVLAFGDNVYFANIPNLWLLRDDNGDGKADTRMVLHAGFGVRYNISGHDLHGLRVGPDGRLYFSIGDRALHVVGPGGKPIVSNPDSGAVLRCEPDGSNLELVHTGLRNPQDLAFDDYGNLFTGDNNSDGGDASRWVYVVEGGDSGWRTGYQWHDFPTSRGPWNNERLWDVKSDVPAAYLVPPIANPDVAGPAGLTYVSGVGMPPDWKNRFLLVDFRGGASNSGVWALQNKPKGASFELVETKKLVWGSLATDVECGYDGSVYFSDWVTGWVPMGKGRIYRLTHEATSRDPAVKEVRRLMAEGFAARPVGQLTDLLAHADGRVRLAAQFELVRRKELPAIRDVALRGSHRLARLHAIWAMRRLELPAPTAVEMFRSLLQDPDEEIRAQAVKVVGDRRDGRASGDVLRLFRDPSDRVRFFAAVAAGRLGIDCSADAIELLRDNDSRDPYLRHAAVMALTGHANVPAMLKAADDPSAAVRAGVVVALRRLKNPGVAAFLSDGDPAVVLEAARAINDEPIDDAVESLAALALKTDGVGAGKVRDLILARALNANFRTGAAASAAVLAQFAQRSDVPGILRVEALRMLGTWGTPATRDRVTGVYHPRPARDPAVSNAAVRPVLAALLRDAPDAVRVAAAGLIPVTGLSDTAVLLEVVNSARFSGEVRAAALAALAAQKPQQLAAAVDAALKEKNAALRRAAIRAAASLPDGPARLRKLIVGGATRDQQAALATVGSLPAGEAAAILVDALDRLVAGKVSPEVRLDLTAAAEARRDSPDVAAKLLRYRSTFPKDDPLAPYRDALVGGDVAQGRKIFRERADVQCLRCHAVKGEGGHAGPDLAGIGRKQTRDYLLESIVQPAARIAAGWETVIIRVKSGDTFAGVLKSEDTAQIVLVDPEKGDVRIEKATVTARRGGQSAMPADIAAALSPHDLRDVIEFLASLK